MTIEKPVINLEIGKLYKLIAYNNEKESEFYAIKCKDINKPVLPIKIFKENGTSITVAIEGKQPLNDNSVVNLLKINSAEEMVFGMKWNTSVEFFANGSPIYHNPEFETLEKNVVNCCIFEYKGILLSCSEKDFTKCFVVV